MVTKPLQCRHCQSTRITRNGLTSNQKQRYRPVETYCCNPEINPDLCLDKKGNLKPLCGDCYNCYWECLFDDDGNPIFDKNGKQSRIKNTDPTPRKRPCCRNIDNEKYRKSCAV
jgi:hypothetical protein